MPIDINELRTYKGGNPDAYRTYMKQRFKDPSIIDQVLAKDEEWRNLRTQIDSERTAVNKFQKEVLAPKKKAKEPCDDEAARAKAMRANIAALEERLPVIAAERDALLNQVGNIVDPEVPIASGDDEDEANVVVTLYPEPLEADNGGDKPLLPCRIAELSYTLPPTKPLTHDDLLWRIDGYEPMRGQQVAGHRGTSSRTQASSSTKPSSTTASPSSGSAATRSCSRPTS